MNSTIDLIKSSFKKASKIRVVISTLFLLFLMFSTSYFVYSLVLLSGIENLIRYVTITCSIILLILFVAFWFIVLVKNKFIYYLIYFLFILLLLVLQIFIAFYITKGLNLLDRISREYVTYSTSLVTMVDSSIEGIGDVENLKIGIIDQEDSVEGYIISKEIINDYNLDDANEIIEFDDFVYMIGSLYKGEVDLVFLSSNYSILFSSIEVYEAIREETKIIYSKEKTLERDVEKAKARKNIDEPFTLLLMGVDSDKDGLNQNAAFNGDALMVITFNPNTFNATILSIPRDTYVPIMCFRNQIENKITHAGWHGESCVISTVENFIGIDIDYYVTTNFRGVIDLVDTLGGIEVDVPTSFCVPDSVRNSGKEVCLEKGLQTLDGEEALALTRNRKIPGGDISRGLNQQIVVQSTLNKLKEINNLNEIYNILDSVSNNVNTNLEIKEILSFYEVGKELLSRTRTEQDPILIQQLFLYGHDTMIWDERMRLTLYNYVYNKASYNDVVTAMRINLELEAPEMIKEFSFSINTPYELSIIGRGPYPRDNFIPTLPNFRTRNREWAINWGNQNNVSIVFETVAKDHPDYSDAYRDNQIISQSFPFGYKLENLTPKEVTLKIIKKNSSPQVINCYIEENYTNSKCIIPSFVGWTISEFNTWNSGHSGNFEVIKEKTDVDDPSYDEEESKKVYYQNESSGTSFVDIDTLIIKYYE